LKPLEKLRWRRKAAIVELGATSHPGKLEDVYLVDLEGGFDPFVGPQ